MTEPMDVDRAIEVAMNAIGCLDFCDPNETRDVGDTSAAYAVLESLRARLRREREAIEKVRDEMGVFSSVSMSHIGQSWLAALDAILRGEGTT